MSRDIVPRSARSAVGLVVAARVQDQLPEQFAVFGEHPHPKVVHQHEDPGAQELPAEPDVVQPGVVTKGDDPGDVALGSPFSRGEPTWMPGNQDCGTKEPNTRGLATVRIRVSIRCPRGACEEGAR